VRSDPDLDRLAAQRRRMRQDSEYIRNVAARERFKGQQAVRKIANDARTEYGMPKVTMFTGLNESIQRMTEAMSEAAKRSPRFFGPSFDRLKKR